MIENDAIEVTAIGMAITKKNTPDGPDVGATITELTVPEQLRAHAADPDAAHLQDTVPSLGHSSEYVLSFLNAGTSKMRVVRSNGVVIFIDVRQ